MKLCYIVIIFIAFGLYNLAVARGCNETYKKQIKSVVESFRLSITNKDKEKLKSLLYGNDNYWIHYLTYK